MRLDFRLLNQIGQAETLKILELLIADSNRVPPENYGGLDGNGHFAIGDAFNLNSENLKYPISNLWQFWVGDSGHILGRAAQIRVRFYTMWSN